MMGLPSYQTISKFGLPIEIHFPYIETLWSLNESKSGSCFSDVKKLVNHFLDENLYLYILKIVLTAVRTEGIALKKSCSFFSLFT